MVVNGGAGFTHDHSCVNRGLSGNLRDDTYHTHHYTALYKAVANQTLGPILLLFSFFFRPPCVQYKSKIEL